MAFEKFKSALAAPTDAKVTATVALIISFIALGMSVGILMGLRSLANGR